MFWLLRCVRFVLFCFFSVFFFYRYCYCWCFGMEPQRCFYLCGSYRIVLCRERHQANRQVGWLCVCVFLFFIFDRCGYAERLGSAASVSATSPPLINNGTWPWQTWTKHLRVGATGRLRSSVQYSPPNAPLCSDLATLHSSSDQMLPMDETLPLCPLSCSPRPWLTEIRADLQSVTSLPPST